MSETYERTRERHLTDWGAALPDRMARLHWSAEQISAHRTAALRALVVHARNASPWHTNRLHDIDVDALSADDLTSLPTMSKQDLLQDFDDVVTDRRVTRAAADAHLEGLVDDAYFCGDLHVVASGGSTGERAVFVYGWDAWIDVHQGLARFVTNLFSEPDFADGRLTVGVVTAGNATHMTAAMGQTFRSDLVHFESFPVTLAVADIVAGLNELQPTILTAYASMLGVLTSEAHAGRLRIQPRRLLATSEPLLPEIRTAAEETFGAPVSNCWGTSEAGVMAMGCWKGDGMHLNEDLVVIEPVDADGRPVAPGATSAKVLLTNLFNPVMPLIRYELTDEVTMLDEPCACGSAHRRVADVQGRLDDFLVYGTTRVHPHVLRSVLGRQPAIVEYQVIQTTSGAGVRVRAAGRVDETAIARKLESALAAAGVPAPSVTVTTVEALERHGGTGKLRRFVPLSRVAASH
jgi:phenylacetate-coenzyme A ligase PaaK-like adenylate-forming protein